MTKKILIIGGGGYIGTDVIDFFLKKNFSVFCNDNFIFDHSYSIKDFKKNKNFHLLRFDFRQTENFSEILGQFYGIIFLGGLVGDPITKKYPSISRKINLDGIKNFIRLCKKKFNGRFIFVSTCSNYGLSKTNKYLKESSKLNPISYYAKDKVAIEKYMLSIKKIQFIPTILRFSTAFGLSRRMRFDLTINQFVKELYNKKKLEVYDLETFRPYCHVKDFSRIIYKVLISKKKIVYKQVFNIGDKKNNFNKRDIIKTISKFIKIKNLKFISGDKDKRNYRVDFSKMNKLLKCKTKYSVSYGIKEIITFLKKNSQNRFLNYGNYKIKIKK